MATSLPKVDSIAILYSQGSLEPDVMEDNTATRHDTLSINRITGLIEAHEMNICGDLLFLISVALTVEERSDRWLNRTFNCLRLALKMNQLSGKRVDRTQLVAATLAHDFAMGFLPIDILDKKGKLSVKARNLMRTHISSASDLIHRMGKWPEAREMIQAHHEHVDGTGYPYQLNNDEICDGAKILAIVDAFTAQGSNNIMHGVMEVNRHCDTQFSSQWMVHFNTAIQQIYKPAR